MEDIKLCLSGQLVRKAPHSTLGRHRGRLNCLRTGKLRGTAQVRQIVLHRNRRGRGSLPSAAESNPWPCCLSVECAQKCQHEQNRHAANAHEECNQSGHNKSEFSVFNPMNADAPVFRVKFIQNLPPPSNRQRRARGSIGGHGSMRQQKFGGARPAEARNRQWRRVVFPGAPTRNGQEGRVQQ
jgi:hypothetical protein